MKILIVKTSSLGDIIQSFPVLDYLRHKFPDGQIDWIVESSFAELVRANPQIDHVLTIESKKWRKNPFKKENRQQLGVFREKIKETNYDLLFDLQGNLKSSVLLCSINAKEKVGFGWRTVHEWPNALFTSCRIDPPKGRNIREDYLAIVKGYFKDMSPYIFRPIALKLNAMQQQKLSALFFNIQTRPVLVCPFSAWPNKCLSEEILIKILMRINQSPYWFIWSNAHERENALRLSSNFPKSIVLERVSLPLLQHIMSRCKLIIAMDSLPLHLCGTTSTSALSFFGPSSAAKFAPIGANHYAIQGSCPYGQSFEKTCPKLRNCETGLCLKVTDQVDRWAETASRACF